MRAACARVARRARHVEIRPEPLEAYAAALPVREIAAPAPEPQTPTFAGDPEAAACWALVLDAVNFGSGWFPHLDKRRGLSGYRTIEASLRDHFAREGTPSTAALRGMDAARCAEIFGQRAGRAPIAELMELYARAWRELGELVESRYGGAFLALVRAAGGSAERLVRQLLELPLYRDVASYDGAPVPFLKRAQLTAWDLGLLLGRELGAWRDVSRLTLFADNLVPHVLRIDGVLQFVPALVERIEREEPIPSGSPEEVEIRACAVSAVERLVDRLRARGADTCAAELDLWLWRRGAGARYKARPRHRTRCPYY